jgi:hypothetical protein
MSMLYTTNCIVTGKPARVWGGHVIIPNLTLHLMEKNAADLIVVAGFADKQTKDDHRSGDLGYCGVWKEQDGLKVH